MRSNTTLPLTAYLEFNSSRHSSPALPSTTFSTKPPAYEMNFEDWSLILAFVLIMVVGVSGNSLVIYVFGFRTRNKRKTTEILILYLGVIDLLSSLLNPSLNIYWLANNYGNWKFGWFGCKIIPVIGPVMTTSSSCILLIFAAERYCAVVRPFAKLTSKTVKLACLASVGISMGMYGHYVNALTLTSSGYCYVPDSRAPKYGYPNCIFIAIRLLAFVSVFSVTNIRIYQRLRSNEKKLFVDSSKDRDRSRSKHIMRILNTMGVVFVILVFPRELLQLSYNMSQMINAGGGGIPYGKGIVRLNSWLKVLHTSNSCANICIYAYMQDSYKKEIRKILQWLGCYKELEKEVATHLMLNSHSLEKSSRI